MLQSPPPGAEEPPTSVSHPDCEGLFCFCQGESDPADRGLDKLDFIDQLMAATGTYTPAVKGHHIARRRRRA